MAGPPADCGVHRPACVCASLGPSPSCLCLGCSEAGDPRHLTPDAPTALPRGPQQSTAAHVLAGMARQHCVPRLEQWAALACTHSSMDWV